MTRYEYMTFNQVVDYDKKKLLRLRNEQIADQITKASLKIMETMRNEKIDGWDIVSHSVQFFENRLVLSLLLHRPLQP